MTRSIRPPLLTKATLLRMLADALMLNAALIIALASRYVLLLGVEHVPSSPEAILQIYLSAYLSSAWLLSLISLLIFSANGFYTYGRLYRGSYKALVIAEAIALSYLIFGFLGYLSPGLIGLPRSVPLLAWLLTTIFLIGSRLYVMAWIETLKSEPRLAGGAVAESHEAHILVIGGAGYIGSALLPMLLERNYRVRLLDLFLFGKEPIAALLGHERLEIIEADFRQVDKIVEAMRGIDTVIHLGAIVGDPACALDEQLTIEVNLMATRMIAEVAKGSGVKRFIFASTCSVYGAGDQMLDEHSELKPLSLYAHSKLASEKVLQNLADEDFAPVLLRFGTIYGISGRTRFDLVVNLLAAKAYVDGEVSIFGGNQWRPFLHVEDAARSVLLASEAPLPLVRNQVFNVGSNAENYTIDQVGAIIHRLMPSAQLISLSGNGDRRNYRVSFNKIHNLLGFAPRWTVARGAEQVLAMMASGAVSDYHDARYSNAKFLGEESNLRLIKRETGWAHALLSEQPLLTFAEA